MRFAKCLHARHSLALLLQEEFAIGTWLRERHVQVTRGSHQLGDLARRCLVALLGKERPCGSNLRGGIVAVPLRSGLNGHERKGKESRGDTPRGGN